MKILVTGGTGMLGHALRKFLPDAVYVGSKNGGDLMHEPVACGLVEHYRPDCVIHCAAKVGGIKDNAEHPFDYFTENTIINERVVGACVAYKVPKLIAISSTCVYPANPPSFPITEDMLHLGPPHETNFGYAYAKRMMQVQIDAARKQYGFKWSVIYPSNLYGPHDTFDLQRSHVVPALMLKMHAAKQIGADSVELWGTGKAVRQLTFVDDLADTIAWVAQNDHAGDFNFATPVNDSIEYLAAAMRVAVGFHGSVEFNGVLDGVMHKEVDVSRIPKRSPHHSVFPFTSLHAGLRQTYDWYTRNVA